MSASRTRRWTAGRTILASLSVLGMAFVTTLPSQAQIIVIQSNAKGIRVGSTIENDKIVKIPAGKQATFVLPSGSTRTVSGPFDGKAADLTKGVKANPDILAAIKRYVQTGGASNSTVGATRSLASVAFSKPLPFSWRAVPVSASGDYCIEKGATVSLVRPASGRAQTVTVIDLKSKRRSQTSFRASDKRIPWPEEIELNPGTTYAILAQGRPMRKLTLRMIAPLPAREDTLQVLHVQRCESQFRAYIQALQSAG